MKETVDLSSVLGMVGVAMKTESYSTDWKNLDLSRAPERHLNLIEPLSFDDLLLEIDCNLPEINREMVRKQFEEDLANRIKEAREVFELALDSIVSHAQAQRKLV